jgi:hypothetical protein
MFHPDGMSSICGLMTSTSYGRGPRLSSPRVQPEVVAAAGPAPQAPAFPRPPRVGMLAGVVPCGHRRYRIRGFLPFHIEYLPEGPLFVSNPAIGVHGYGADIDEAMGSFCAMFDSQYRDLVEVDEALLAPHALPLRRRLSACVHSVVELPGA